MSSSEEDSIRRTLVESPSELPGAPAPANGPRHATPSDAADLPATERFRPRLRPPMAVLQLVDDGQRTAQLVRMRSATLTLGRSDADVTIPHDPLISSRHAELFRRQEADGFRFYLRDLNSTNGSFVKVREAIVEDRSEIILGRTRFRFECSVADRAEAPQLAEHQNIRQTSDWRNVQPATGSPALVELRAQGQGRTLPLAAAEHWLGRDPRRCDPVLLDDITVCPRHARLYRDERGRWRIEDAGSLNGVWLRVTEPISLGTGGYFLLGEQEFVFRVL